MIEAKNKTTLYEQVVEVTSHYLGPAAERFVDRQIRMHLDKDPENLTKKDLQKLTDWIKLAMSLLSDDNRLIDEYSERLNALTKNKKSRHESK